MNTSRILIFRFFGLHLLCQFLPIWGFLVPIFAKSVLGMANVAVVSTGGSDSTAFYVRLLLTTITSLLGTIVWHYMDRKNDFQKRLPLILFGIRYFLALVMLLYGFGKLAGGQFPEPSFDQLLRPLGDTPPNELLWIFMGSSTSYAIFTGVVEIAAGLFLFFPKTRTLGALTAFATMVNVVMLNYGYDVPVKLFATYLLMLSGLLLSLDAKRLYQLFLSNESVAPVVYYPLFTTEKGLKRANLFKKALLTTLVLGFSSLFFVVNIERNKTFPLHGIYDVSSLEVVNGDENLPSWKYFAVEFKNNASIHFSDGTIVDFGFNVKKEDGTIEVNEADQTHLWQFEEKGEELHLNAKWQGQEVQVQLKRRPEGKHSFTLINHGFHWITDTPFNQPR